MSSDSEIPQSPMGEGTSAQSTTSKNAQAGPSVDSNTKKQQEKFSPNIFIRFLRSLFGYRKTSLTIFVFLTFIATVALSSYDNSLEYTVNLPSKNLEKTVLDNSWTSLQKLAKFEHAYTSRGNDYIHDYIEEQIKTYVHEKSYVEYDNDLNYTNNILFKTKYLSYDSVSYYESNNLIVRINGSRDDLPALLLSAHYDSVPSSYGVTDDGFGVASLLGVLNYYVSKNISQPERSIILNFNNNEEFGLYGATSFLSHPWFKQIKYFLNLEGTGAGGKAVLFRATDYGIVKYFKGVRYPHATSLYQQGFNNHLIHSETDYKVYKEKGGIRGLDLAFYKPRDIYHTGGDNIKNVNIKSLWHMLSNTLDFVEIISSQQLDLDDEYLGTENHNSDREFSVYASFLNYFFAITVPQLVIINIIFLVVVPFISFPFLFINLYYKKNWNLNFINVIKFPLSLIFSTLLIKFVTRNIILGLNEFLPNSSFGLIVTSLLALFLFSNYIILNGINFVFKSYKGNNHDEKLIVIIEISFIYWVALIWSSVKLSNNRIGDDHTGEFPLILLFILQSVGATLGLIGWTFGKSNINTIKSRDEAVRPLLSNSGHQNYGTHEYEHEERYNQSLASSLLSSDSDASLLSSSVGSEYFSYDWSIQFLVIVPVSSLIIYNTGNLILDGINKSIQESLEAQNLIYTFIEAFAVIWALPFLPFIFKLNKVIVLALLLIVLQGFVSISLLSPFDQSNPLKLRFIQNIDLNTEPATNYVQVTGRDTPLVKDILSDIPSLKASDEILNIDSLGDGVLTYSYKSTLAPNLVAGISSFNDYLQVQVLKNSSSNVDYPFGLLSGEIEINVPKNRNCKLNFNLSDSIAELYKQSAFFKDTPVKTVIVYSTDDKNTTSHDFETRGIPEGFSIDKNGNYLYKDLSGIDELQLNKLDWDKSYHIGFQWVPNLVDLKESVDTEKVKLNKLGVNIQCYWGDLGFLADKEEVKEIIPAYGELLHYSPNFVSWANKDRGLVSIQKYFEI